MRNYVFGFSLTAMALLIASPVFAMSITNQDGETRRVVITQDGARSEQDIAPGEVAVLCETGCFITFPDGTLTAYLGDEKIVIRNGGPALAN